MSGPKTGESSGTTATTLITRPVRFGPATRASRACPVAGSSPPPRPWITRKTIRLVADQASAHSTEPSRNTPTAASQVRLPPNRSASQPDAGTAATTASRYPVVTHWISATDAPNSSVRASMPTLTMVASRVAMKVPSTRMKATRSSCRSTPSTGVRRPCSSSLQEVAHIGVEVLVQGPEQIEQFLREPVGADSRPGARAHRSSHRRPA